MLILKSSDSGFFHFSVVNLTLVDLPGLTKVAVGMCVCSVEKYSDLTILVY